MASEAEIRWCADEVVRELAPSEQRFVRHGVYNGWTVLVEGELDTERIRSANAVMRCAYPVLNGRIGAAPDGPGYLLLPVATRPEGVWVRSGDPDAVAEPPPMDPAEQLGYLDVVCAPGRARVTLFAHHSIADGRFGMEAFALLWDLYTDPRSDVVAQDFPQSLEWHVAVRGYDRGPLSGFECVARALADDPPPDPADAGALAVGAFARPVRITLDAEVTRGLVQLARGTGVGVNSLVTAVLLRAYAAETGTGAVPLGAMYAVDLRDRLYPAIPATAGTNLAGMACYAAEIDSGCDPVVLARAVSERLRRDLSCGLVQQSVLHVPDYFGEKRIHSLAGHLAITNPGVVAGFRTPPDLRIVDYEIVFRLAHPQPSAEVPPAAAFLFYTFADRLTVGYLGRAVDPGRLLDAIGAELSVLSGEPYDPMIEHTDGVDIGMDVII